MPKPKDLTGEKYGNLVVLSDTGKYTKHSRPKKIWLCKCDCGATEEIDQLKLPYNESQKKRRGVRYCCTVCSRGPCNVCGGPIKDIKYKTCCSDKCHKEYKQLKWREEYYKRIKRDPDLNIKAFQRKIKKIKSDPDLYKKYLDEEKERGKQKRSENSELLNQQARERYWRDHKSSLDKKRKYRKKNRNRIRENNRKYQRKNAQKLAKSRADKFNALSPQERENYRAKINARARQIYREKKRQQELQKLFGIGEKLNEKSNE